MPYFIYIPRKPMERKCIPGRLSLTTPARKCSANCKRSLLFRNAPPLISSPTDKQNKPRCKHETQDSSDTDAPQIPNPTIRPQHHASEPPPPAEAETHSPAPPPQGVHRTGHRQGSGVRIESEMAGTKPHMTQDQSTPLQNKTPP